MRPVFGNGYRAANPIRGFSNLKFYVDAAITPPHVSSASNIDSWTDLSGTGNTLNTLNANAPQKTGDNGAKSVAASTQGITKPAANSIGTGAYTIGLVVFMDALVDNGIIIGDADLSGGVGNGGVNLRITSSKWVLDHYLVANAAVSTANAPTTGGFHSVIFSRAASSAPVFYLDGVSQSLSSSSTSNPLSSGTGIFSGLSLFTFGNFDSAHSSCQILAAFICGGTAIGATNAARVHTYWKYRYGLPT